jgi:hypothetical protein
MHGEYQLAYCPIAHISSLEFSDGAFENSRLTPEFLHKLRVPKRLHVDFGTGFCNFLGTEFGIRSFEIVVLFPFA